MDKGNKVRYAKYLALCAVLAASYGCVDQQTPWQRIIRTGQLRFATVAGPHTCYQTSTGFAGIEYELARRFADEMGVKLTLVMARDPYAVMTMVAHNSADIGGAGLTGHMAQNNLSAGPAYYHAALQLVFRHGDRRPVSIESLGKNSIPITSDQIGRAHV